MADAADRYIGSEAAATLRATPRVEEFVQWHLAATPVAAAVAALSDEGRGALAKDVGTALKSYADGDGVAFPDESSLVTAHT